MQSKILLLGGTSEALQIAAALVAVGHDVTTSFAGVTSNPILPRGKIRVGGFGGMIGLRDYLVTGNFNVLIDATHPFAAIISNNAFEAVQNTTTALLRIERPAWKQGAGDKWIEVASLLDADEQLPAHAHVFVTTGRKNLAPFFNRFDLTGAIRTVEPPVNPLPLGWRLILDRPPHTLQDEVQLIKAEAFTHLVTKNAGSNVTRAKLDAARLLGLPVIMVQRPTKPACETFTEVDPLILRLGTSGCNG
jgi:precorrin-6A/cobalt-precorrin-6A reductase